MGPVLGDGGAVCSEVVVAGSVVAGGTVVVESAVVVPLASPVMVGGTVRDKGVPIWPEGKRTRRQGEGRNQGEDGRRVHREASKSKDRLLVRRGGETEETEKDDWKAERKVCKEARSRSRREQRGRKRCAKEELPMV